MREQSSERNTETLKDLVTIPEGSHPFPSRTRKLRPPGLMILGPQGPGKVSRCQVVQETIDYDGLFALGSVPPVRRRHVVGLCGRVAWPK